MFRKNIQIPMTVVLALVIVFGAMVAVNYTSRSEPTDVYAQASEDCEVLRDGILTPHRINRKASLLFAGSDITPYDLGDESPVAATMGIMLPPDWPEKPMRMYDYRTWTVQAIAFDRDTNEVIYDKYTIHIDYRGALRVGGYADDRNMQYGEKTYDVEYGKPLFEYKTNLWLDGGEDWQNKIWITADGYKDSPVFTHTISDTKFYQECDLTSPFVILEFYLEKEE